MSEPREGLPPCLRLVVANERAVSLCDSEGGCTHFPGVNSFRFAVLATRVESRRSTPENPTPLSAIGNPVLELATADADEAKAAFERGAEYVRTGVLE